MTADGPDFRAAVPADLRAAARSITDTGSRNAATERTVDVLADDVGVDHACVYLRNDSPPVLYAAARTDPFEERFDFASTIEESEGPIDRAVSSGEPVVGALPEDPPVEAGLQDADGWCLVPLGGEGVLVVVTPDSRGLKPDQVAAIDLVGAYLEAALAHHIERGELPGDARLQALSQAFPDYAFVYDADGRYVDVLLGETNIQLYRRQELLGSTVHEVMDGDVAAFVQDAIDEALATGEMQVLEYGVDTPGGVYWYESRAVPVAEGPGDETVVLVARDITERYEREQELQRQNERLEEFASIVSHDLRNPLNVASAHADLARETGDLDHLEAVAESHERMEALIADLLTLAHEGRNVEDPTDVSLSETVREAWNAVDTADATLSLPADDERLLADRPQLQQLFENLFRNSIEHGRDDVEVRVETIDDGFAVADDGPGIPEDDRTDVFEPGHSHAGGTGLGLTIVESVVDAHDWSIAVADPKSDDGGARFEITGVERP